MGLVLVYGADKQGAMVVNLRVKIPKLPARTIDRDTALQWMSDGHSLIPVVHGQQQPVLQRVDVGDEPQWFIRHDNAKEASDALPELPSTEAAGV